MAGHRWDTRVNGFGDGYGCASSFSSERHRSGIDEEGLWSSTSGGDRPIRDFYTDVVSPGHMHWACGGQVATSCNYGESRLASDRVTLRPAPLVTSRGRGRGRFQLYFLYRHILTALSGW
jgi:hypothetical protein